MSDQLLQIPENPRSGTEPATGNDLPGTEPAEGGDAACWAHLVCPDCGAIAGDGHRPDCRARPPASPQD